MRKIKYKVLVIEDDIVDQMAFKRLVKDKSFPYNFTFASSLSEAWKFLGSEKYDLVITDYSLGDGTAFDILDSIKDTPSIIVTGTGNEEIAVKAMKAGAYDYLIKDVENKYLTLLPATIEKTIKRDKITKQFRMLSHAIKNVNDSVFITDMDNKIVFINDTFSKTYGYKEEDILGKDSNILGEIDREGESYHLRKDGNVFPVELSSAVLKDEDGKEVAVVRIAHNITERKKMEEELKKLASTDRLTQAYNRLKFEEIITREIERVKRYNQSLSMAMLDIDYFKKVNDTYGHLAGDYVLKTIADIVRENIRKIDYLVRWGGEEFMIISPETDLERAKELAERIRKVIENYSFDKVQKVTVSFGVSQFKEDDTEDDFIKRVDDAMYKAKTSGRNRVEISV